MELLVKIAWAALAAVHAAPAAVLFAPSLVEKLYGVSPDGEAGLLIVHRGALFLAVIAAALWALIQPTARQTATIVVAISMLGFLFVYARAGFPVGALRKIAVADAAALVPLAIVLWDAWVSKAGR